MLISRRDVRNWSAWTEVIGSTAGANSANGHSSQNGDAHNGISAAVNGAGTGNEELETEEDDTIENRTVFRNISGYITSDSVLLFHDVDVANTNSPASAISIPYPSISLHAIQRVTASSPTHSTREARKYHSSTAQATSQTQTSALYLQLDLGNPFTRNPDSDEDAAETVDLLLIPQTSTTPTRATADAGTISEPTAAGAYGTEGAGAQAKELQADAKTIFEALTRCADLHPDPDASDEDDVDGGAGDLGMGGGMPGASGWITSENVHEFEGMFGGDEDGDGSGVGEREAGDEAVVQILGPGAGSRRARDDAEEGATTGTPGEADEEGDGESKWRRTS